MSASRQCSKSYLPASGFESLSDLRQTTIEIVADFVLPEAKYGPSGCHKVGRDFLISRTVLSQLLGPELDIGCWGPVAQGTSMPETAIYEDRHSPSRERDIGSSQYACRVDPITDEPCCTKRPSQLEFLSRVPVPHSPHVSAPLFWRMYVSQARLSFRWGQWP